MSKNIDSKRKLEITNLVIGYFKPKITNNLQTEAVKYIGELFQYSPMWKIKPEDSLAYQGQWALMPLRMVSLDDREDWGIMRDNVGLRMGIWLPEEDVSIIEIVS